MEGGRLDVEGGKQICRALTFKGNILLWSQHRACFQPDFFMPDNEKIQGVSGNSWRVAP
jgi:hypothetical protein